MSKPDITDSIANFLLQDHVELMRENAALREAAEMALEALTLINKDIEQHRAELPVGRQSQLLKASLALRQALAQPDEVLAEREACAKVCDDICFKYSKVDDYAERVASQWCAEAIRARGEK